MRSGHNVGVLGQLHFYLDDPFPNSPGRPHFGDNGNPHTNNPTNIDK